MSSFDKFVSRLASILTIRCLDKYSMFWPFNFQIFKTFVFLLSYFVPRDKAGLEFRDLPTSVSQELRLKVCTTISGSKSASWMCCLKQKWPIRIRWPHPIPVFLNAICLLLVVLVSLWKFLGKYGSVRLWYDSLVEEKKSSAPSGQERISGLPILELGLGVQHH